MPDANEMVAFNVPPATPPPAKKTVPERKSKLQTKTQKLAGFLIMLGPDLAAEIMKSFNSATVREITTEIARMEMVDFETQQELLEQFSQIAIYATTAVRGGTLFTREVLERSLGAFQANEMIQNVSPRKATSIDTSFLQESNPSQVYNLIKSEDPQTIALVLSYLEPAKCGETLALLDTDLRADVVARIASMEPISVDVLGKVLNTLRKRVTTEHTLSSKPGGLKAIAEVINNMDTTTSRSLLATLDEKNPQLSSSLKKILFTFDEFKKLDRLTLQRILREVESKDLSLALKTASEELQMAVYGALPKRAAENIKEDIKLMGPVRLRDIEAAQDRIIEIMRKLEVEGEIILNTGGKSDVVV
ncbi:MAG: flagellar motor switch protein FliG [Verrucomicrobia bacterium]|nr:flagellar motor switch protein FliG [Verrucomicrobiota bacterium]